MKRSFVHLLLLFILTYPLLYFVYKFSLPWPDFYSYYLIYHDLNYETLLSPFNIRLLSTSIVHLFYQIGFYYDTQIAFSDPNFEQAIFFNSILVSYLAVVITCYAISRSIFVKVKNYHYAAIMSLLYLFGFGTLVHAMSGLTDGFSIMIIALIFYYYQKKQLLPLILFLVMSLFQREMVFFFIGILAISGIFFKDHIKFNWIVLVCCGLGFGVYYLLLNSIFYTGSYDEVLAMKGFQLGFRDISESIPSLKQIFGAQNILILYFLILVYKRFKKMEIDNKNLVVVVLVLLMVIGIIVFLRIGNNAGRILYMIAPFVIYYIALEVYPLFQKSEPK